MQNKFVWGSVVLLAMLAASAGAADKTPVCMETVGKDTVGLTLAYTVKEQLLASQSYEVVPLCKNAMFVLGIVTVDDTENVSTAASVALSLENPKGYDYLITHWVMTSGRNKVAASATNLIAAMDKYVQDILKALAK